MNFKMALGALLAFSAALLLGRLLLPQQHAELPAGVPFVAPADLLQTSASPAYTQAYEETLNQTYYDIDRNFKLVDGGAENDNKRLTHFIARNYEEGILHKAKHQFGAWLRWVPMAQEFLRGAEVAAVNGPRSAVGRLEQTGELSRYSYADTYPDTDERFIIRPDGGLEHDIILKDPPAGLSDIDAVAFSGTLQLDPTLTLWDEDNKTQITGAYRTSNAVHVKNAFGNTVFLIRRPIAFDADVTLPDGSLDKEKQADPEHNGRLISCQYWIDFTDAGIKFSVVTPTEWLLHPNRTYPVTIDPNTGTLGLRDSTFPVYIGTPGTKSQIPLHTYGTPIRGEDPCNNGRPDLEPKADNDYGMITLPFDFNYYNQIRPTGTSLFVHYDGWASFIAPYPKYNPLAPPLTACFDDLNTGLPDGNGGTRNDAMYAYWDDLRISNEVGSGVYQFLEGIKPNRRLIIEWHKMGFVNGANNDVISFNLILYECDSKIEVIIGAEGETDQGYCTVGIEDQGGTRGIQYDYNSATTVPPGTPPVPPGTVQQTAAIEPIPPGTSILFEFAPTSNLVVQFTALNGCRPHKVCFKASAATVQSSCDLNKPGQTFGFNWKFFLQPRSGTFSGAGVVDPTTGKVLLHQGFTASYCQQFIIPGKYDVVLEVTDRLGIISTYPDPIQVLVCDTPSVVITATPQGGPAPLDVRFETRTNRDDLLQITRAVYVFDQLGVNNDPNEFANMPPSVTVGDGEIVDRRFDAAGIYRVRVFYDGTDVITNLPTQGSGTVFIFVTGPNAQLEDAIIITESQFKIDWKGKVDGPDPDGQAPNTGSAIPGEGVADNPNNDRLFARGFLNLAGWNLSQLTGRIARIVGNGSEILAEGRMDASGKVVGGNPATGRISEFGVSLPSGQFYMNTKGDLYGALTLANLTQRQIMPIHYRIEIEGAFPPSGTTGSTIVTYDYASTAGAQAKGTYKFGMHTKDGTLSNSRKGFKRPGGYLGTVSGGIMALQSKAVLRGGFVTLEIGGLLARPGGDDIRPTEQTDITLRIGAFSETLNFALTPTFKTTGKVPRQRFSFKKDKGLGEVGIAEFTFQNGQGNFFVKTHPIPNELIGLNPALATQIMSLGLTITNDNNVTTTGTTRFEVNKVDEETFVRNSKQ